MKIIRESRFVLYKFYSFAEMHKYFQDNQYDCIDDLFVEWTIVGHAYRSAFYIRPCVAKLSVGNRVFVSLENNFGHHKMENWITVGAIDIWIDALNNNQIPKLYKIKIQDANNLKKSYSIDDILTEQEYFLRSI